jgi:hypothetical protein
MDVEIVMEEVKMPIKENLSSHTYIDIDGEFIRQTSVIEFQVE